MEVLQPPYPTLNTCDMYTVSSTESPTRSTGAKHIRVIRGVTHYAIRDGWCRRIITIKNTQHTVHRRATPREGEQGECEDGYEVHAFHDVPLIIRWYYRMPIVYTWYIQSARDKVRR